MESNSQSKEKEKKRIPFTTILALSDFQSLGAARFKKEKKEPIRDKHENVVGFVYTVYYLVTVKDQLDAIARQQLLSSEKLVGKIPTEDIYAPIYSEYQDLKGRPHGRITRFSPNGDIQWNGLYEHGAPVREVKLGNCLGGSK